MSDLVCACGRRFWSYDNWVKRGIERRKVRFFGCPTCPGEWQPINDMEFYTRKPLNKRAAVTEAERLIRT